jgi:hypothetical protein
MALQFRVNQPRYQHWLPQFYLRHFAVPGFRNRNNAKIWFWAKNDSEPEKRKVRHVCAKEYLYSFVREDGQLDHRTEKHLAEVEATISRLYPRIAEGFPDLAHAWGIKKLVALFLSTLLLRHPHARDETKRTHHQLVNWCETLAKDSQGRPIMPDYEHQGQRYPFDNSRWEEYRDADENEITKMFTDNIRRSAISLANRLFEKRWAFLCLDEPRLFTSDFPVVVKHPDQKVAGIGTAGVHMFFPVSPTRMLHISDRGEDPDGFYPFPSDRAAELNFFTFGNSRQFILSHEQPAAMLNDLDLFQNQIIAREYARYAAAL